MKYGVAMQPAEPRRARRDSPYPTASALWNAGRASRRAT